MIDVGGKRRGGGVLTSKVYLSLPHRRSIFIS
jgi:hypothetical protein